MELIITGDVQDVLSGNITKKKLYSVSTDRVKYALGGAGEIKDNALNIGEAIVYEGIGYIFTLNHFWIEKKTMQAPFLIGISQKPTQENQIGPTKSIDILYQSLLKKFPKGFALIGECYFSNLAVAYLKKSPIYHENINTYKDQYWSNEEFTNRFAKIFGIALPNPDPRIFYQNPNESTLNNLPSHTHALMKDQARHLLTHSSILSAHLWIDSIDSIIES